MSLRLMSSMISGDNKEEINKKKNEGQKALGNLLSAVQSCQARYGGKAELATEDDIRVAELCCCWAGLLSHGLRPPLLTAPASLHAIVSAGINYAFNINSQGTSLWNYTRLHLTRHEEERFKLLKIVNTPMGMFKAFLRASLNERSLERYLHSWVGHSLVTEYYEEWAIMRDSEATNLLPNMAAGLASILFALSIDKAELNEVQLPTNHSQVEIEPVIALKAPVHKTSKKKSLRQVISFETEDETFSITDSQVVAQGPTMETFNTHNIVPACSGVLACSSAPASCGGSPAPGLAEALTAISSYSEPATSDYDTKNRFFTEDSLVSPEKIYGESPGQILARLSEKARDMFSSKKSLTVESASLKGSDISSLSGGPKRLSESDSDAGAGTGSCLELCFPEDEAPESEEDHLQAIIVKQQEEKLALQLKLTQIEVSHKEKVCQMERLVVDLNRENDRLKEQLRKYISAVQLLKQDGAQSEVKQYEAKLVQVAEMHAELMEFNDSLQRRLAAESTTSPQHLQLWVPSAFLVSSGSKSFHVYQVFLKVGTDEWNVYRRYSEFRKLYSDLKNTHPDIAPFKFPPKKALGKKEAWLVERRRGALQAWLRHVALVLPQLHSALSKQQLLTLLPFFREANCSWSPGNQLCPAPVS